MMPNLFFWEQFCTKKTVFLQSRFWRAQAYDPKFFCTKSFFWVSMQRRLASKILFRHELANIWPELDGRCVTPWDLCNFFLTKIEYTSLSPFSLPFRRYGRRPPFLMEKAGALISKWKSFHSARSRFHMRVISKWKMPVILKWVIRIYYRLIDDLSLVKLSFIYEKIAHSFWHERRTLALIV